MPAIITDTFDYDDIVRVLDLDEAFVQHQVDARTLNELMDDPTFFIKYHKHGESETRRIIQAFQHSLCQLHLFLSLRFPRIVVQMDIDKSLVNDIAYCSVIRYEVSKPQAPGTPVTSHLTDDELSFRASFH